MTIETIANVKSDISLSLANFTNKSEVILPPPGGFSSADIYCESFGED